MTAADAERLERESWWWHDSYLRERFAYRAPGIIILLFGLLRCRVVHGRGGQFSSDDAELFADQVADACESGLITDRQFQRIFETDVIARCWRRSDSATVWVAVEVAARLGNARIDRAAQSAAALRQVFGEEARAVAAAERITPPDRARAAQAGVTLFNMSRDADGEPE